LFGQPGNPSFNYWMGQYYEAQGQWARAWSRYFRAMLTDNPHPEAGLAIGRLNNNPVFREGFSMQDAQDFLDGYIPIFNPADLPEALENRRLLIEVFTCGDDASCAPLELALQALEETEGVILANYHIGNPAAEPLENRACLAALAGYPGERIPFLVIDGSPVDPNLLPLLNPAEIINGLAALRSPHPPALLQVELTPVSEQEKRWQVTVPVADFKDARRGEILLAEQRCMLFSSTGIVLFRNVVRAGLFNQDLASSGGRMTAELDFNRIQSDNLSYVESIQDSRQIVFNMIPVYIDPKMSFVIAKLYGSDGHLMAVGKQVLDSSQGGGRAR
jgi:hypothetical protein